MAAPARKRSSKRNVRTLSATEFSKQLSDVLNRVHYQREIIVVERGGKPICQLSPVAAASSFMLSDLVALLDTLPVADEEWAKAVARNVAEQDAFEGFAWPR
jgi:antitoxin (DNA-binding transcriptional repressor) of toxin-antitoxin stability system